MNHNATNVLAVLKAHVLPTLAPIGCLVNAVAPVGAALIVGLTGADPNHVFIMGIPSDVANRDGALVLKDAFPCGA